MRARATRARRTRRCGSGRHRRTRLLAISTAKGIAFKMHTTIKCIDKQADGSLLVSFEGEDPPLETDMVLFATSSIAAR